MKNIFAIIFVCIFIESCNYGEAKAEEEIRKLQVQLDTVENAIFQSREYFERRIEDLYEFTSESDTTLNNKIELLWEDFHYGMEDLAEMTWYSEYDFECY